MKELHPKVRPNDFSANYRTWGRGWGNDGNRVEATLMASARPCIGNRGYVTFQTEGVINTHQCDDSESETTMDLSNYLVSRFDLA